MIERIYFDNNSTTTLSQSVRNALMQVQYEPLNPSSMHYFGRKARAIVEEARSKVRKILDVPKNFRIIFTSSATEANNIIITNAKRNGMLISVPKTEHPSILKGTIDNLISVNENGEINLEDIIHKGLYSIMLANNETGVIQSIDSIIKSIRDIGSIIHIDAVQAIGKIPFSCHTIGADAYTISAHKFGGPQGVACLIYNPDVIDIKPLFFGGGQEQGIRPGTENVMAIYGLGIAIVNIKEHLELMQNDILSIRNYIEDRLCNHGIIFGIDAKNRLPNTTSIAMPGVKAELQIAYFDSNGIAVSAGAACSAGKVDHPYVHMAMNVCHNNASCAIRVSLGIENTMEEAKIFINHWYTLYKKYMKE
jgi:cysteine desulfurase